MAVTAAANKSLSTKRIIKTWWPLAASWLLMGAELPVLSAIVARLPDGEINLAAYGGVVFPLALIVEAPIIMLLAASTALSRDWASYLKLRRFMMTAGAALTVLHILVAFTPLYYFVVVKLFAASPEVVEPARIGLMIMTPWTWSIAYRRFNQGVMIRFGHSQSVGAGTMVRLTADALVLVVGYLIGTIPGVVVATSAVAAGVLSEAAFAGWAVRPVVRGPLRQAPPVEQPLTLSSFREFYVPLAMTSLLMLIANPIGSAALFRMPDNIASVAVWPVVTGLIFMLRSLGTALNEVVVALLDEPNSFHSLRRFALALSAVTTAILLLFAATPLAPFWFGKVSALEPHLASLARNGVWIAVPLPALTVLQSWYQGSIMHGRRTRGITESVYIYLLVTTVVLVGGVVWSGTAGLYVGLASMTLSIFAQTAWLWYRSRPVLHSVRRRDEVLLAATD